MQKLQKVEREDRGPLEFSTAWHIMVAGCPDSFAAFRMCCWSLRVITCNGRLTRRGEEGEVR